MCQHAGSVTLKEFYHAMKAALLAGAFALTLAPAAFAQPPATLTSGGAGVYTGVAGNSLANYADPNVTSGAYSNVTTGAASGALGAGVSLGGNYGSPLQGNIGATGSVAGGVGTSSGTTAAWTNTTSPSNGSAEALMIGQSYSETFLGNASGENLSVPTGYTSW
jgi:hypothetical protein